MPEHATSRIRRLVAVATTTLMVAVGLTSAAVGIAPTAANAVQSPASCQGGVALVNGGFEAPSIPSATVGLLPEAQVPGWFTNDSQNVIELWSSGFQGVQPASGRQFAELNAYSASRLYQDVVTSPGQTLTWTLKHRGRNGTDTMRVLLGSATGTLVQNGPNLTDGTASWGSHSGTYLVPAGQTVTRLAFEAVSSAGGNPSVGNFIDDIAFGTGPCLITTKSVANITRGGTAAEVGDVLRYTVTTRNDGGNPALQTMSSDVLPSGVALVPGSMRIVTGAGAGALTDAVADDRGEYSAADRTVRVRLGEGATATAGGSLPVGTSAGYSFDVTVGTSAGGGTITNEARVAYRDTVAVPNLDRISTSQETRTSVGVAADLAIAKTLDTAPLVAGLPATFTIDVTNEGPQTATGVTMTDAVPAGFSNVTATPSSGSCTVGQTITCSLPDLAVGATASVAVTGTASPGLDPGAALINTASVAGARTDPDLSNNTATAAATVTTTADVSVEKTFSPASPVAGQNLTYTVTARNSGPSDARDVRLTDPLDPSEVFVSATPQQGSCAFEGGVLDCSLGTLAPGVTVVTTIVARVAPGATAIVQNSAGITSSTSDPDPSDNVDSVGFEPTIIADLSVEKTASATEVSAGDSVDFTLAVSNLGSADAANVVLDDTLPAGLVVTGVDAPSGGDCTFTVDAIRCLWSAFPVGGPSTVVVHADVAAEAPAGILVNTASVVSPAQDPNTANNSAAVDIEVVQTADLRVQKSAVGDPVPGASYDYRIDVANEGPSTARGATVSDVLPAGFTLGATDGDCTLSAGTLTCGVGDLEPGGSETITLSGTWAPGLVGSVSNTAAVRSATPDPNGSNDVSAVDGTFAPRADVVVSKSTSTPSVPRGGQAVFVVTARNDGPSAAAGMVVAEALPPGLALASAVPSTGTWSAAEALWTVGTLMPGASATLTVTADVVGEGSLTNTATARSQTTDPSPANNTGTATIVATPSADLSASKTISADPAPLNGTVTYTVEVTNTGPSTAAGVRIGDELPTALLRPSTPTPGCTIASGRLDCLVGSLVVGGIATVTVTGTVDPATTQTELSNTASVTSATADPDPQDNSSTVTVPVAGTPRVELVKSASSPVDADADGRIDVGDTVAYSFTIRNVGDVTLTSAAITDPLLGGTVACPAFAVPLPPGGEVACDRREYALTQSDVDRGAIRNAASVIVQSARGSATDDASAIVTVPAVNGIALTKSSSAVTDANASMRVDDGDTIAYTFTVTNTGTTTLADARITDPMLGGAVACANLDGVPLAPGDAVVCEPVVHTLTQRDIDDGVVENTASVSATALSGDVADSASASAALDRTAGLGLVKNAGAVQDADDDGRVGAGDTVAYSFSLRNTGTTMLTGAVISDPLLYDGMVCDLGALAPDAVDECGPFVYTLTQDDIENERVLNTATTNASGPLGPVADAASAEVIIEADTALELTKSPGAPVDEDGDGSIGAGDSLPFTFTIRNSGTTILRDIVVDDPLLGGTLDCPALDGLALDPKAEAMCGPASYTLVQSDIDAGIVRNVAEVRAQSSAGEAEASATADVVVSGVDRLALQKSAAAIEDANGTGRTDAGDAVAYTFTVTNTGTTTLSGVAVTDPRLDGDVRCDVTRLAPDEATVCSGPPAVLTQAEIDAEEIVNTATATATGVGDEALTTEATIRTPLENQPAVALAKTGGEYVDENRNSRIDAGDTVAFRFTVTNTGARTLTDVVIDDPLLGGSLGCEIPDLTPGGTADCGPVRYRLTAADAAAGKVVNVATVRGSAGGFAVTAPATASVDLIALAVTGGVITAVGWALALLAAGALAVFISRSRRSARVYRDSA